MSLQLVSLLSASIRQPPVCQGMSLRPRTPLYITPLPQGASTSGSKCLSQGSSPGEQGKFGRRYPPQWVHVRQRPAFHQGSALIIDLYKYRCVVSVYCCRGNTGRVAALSWSGASVSCCGVGTCLGWPPSLFCHAHWEDFESTGTSPSFRWSYWHPGSDPGLSDEVFSPGSAHLATAGMPAATNYRIHGQKTVTEAH
ncbi:hypothetical protein NPIL_597941 [Nephila pilipes]|uniref:Uncharacterized protein n=1 Tax=Nephila pilipes TaxID=299642 RepID=A0A8X6PD62_NEPPI|nr:hypothetical protein NPIL_597941 [Nephila pilipes]